MDDQECDEWSDDVEPCSYCHGTGILKSELSDSEECWACQGTGYINGL